MEESIVIKREKSVAEISLNRPGAFNSFDLSMIGLLAERLIELAQDHEVKGIIITGTGKAFCAGGDLKWVDTYKGSYGSAFHELAARYHQAILEIRRMPKPVVAAINGLAAGGGFSMALACDFRVMEKSALLRQAYTSNGLSIDGGGTFSLPRIVGIAKSLEIAAFDMPISSEQALEWGLVTEVVEDGGSLKRGTELIIKIIKGSVQSFAASKKLITDSFDTQFEAQLEKEREMLSMCAGKAEGREGILAFLEKRKPDFRKVASPGKME